MDIGPPVIVSSYLMLGTLSTAKNFMSSIIQCMMSKYSTRSLKLLSGNPGQMADPQEALSDLNMYLEEYPGHPEAWFQL